ncbi:MAG: alpha-E domain-containing protein [Anaerolineae bacterium]|nr:alpha-E domain-containing protein [Anaerolineae bacterium]
MLSRVADSLYWLNRYLERAEHTARLTSVYLDIILDQSSQVGDARYQHFLKILELDGEVDGNFTLENLFRLIVLDEANPKSIVSCVNLARENARQVREQISTETWLQINQLYLMMERPSKTLWRQQPQLFMQEMMRNFYLVGGITDATMSHNEGWQFIRLGNYMERANSLVHLVDTHFQTYTGQDPAAEDYLDWVTLLRSCTAFEAYCNVYTANLQPARVAEYLLLNSEFPHSLHFSVNMMYQVLQQVAAITKTQRNMQLNRQAGRLRSLLRFSQIDEIMAAGLHPFLADVQTQCQQIHESIYQVYISFPIAEELPV